MRIFTNQDIKKLLISLSCIFVLYYATVVFVYGFLLVIALVALINILNTVNASVSSRMGNYGVMRAVGMSGS